MLELINELTELRERMRQTAGMSDDDINLVSKAIEEINSLRLEVSDLYNALDDVR